MHTLPGLNTQASAFTTPTPNSGGKTEPEADFSAPRTAGRATKARRKGE